MILKSEIPRQASTEETGAVPTMQGTTESANPDGVGHHGLSLEALSLVAAAWDACVVADIARDVIVENANRRRDSGIAPAGSLVAHAAHLMAAARRHLDAAVVHERLRGSSWEEIAGVLNAPAVVVETRFSPVETRFHDSVSGKDPNADEVLVGDAWWRTYPLLHPEEAALDVDDWVARHDDSGSAHGSPEKEPRHTQGHD